MRENWEGLAALPSPVPRSVNEQPGADPVTPIITMAANGDEISSFLDHQVRKSYLQNIARVEVACSRYFIYLGPGLGDEWQFNFIHVIFLDGSRGHFF